jgi:isopenicillin-N epimerase
MVATMRQHWSLDPSVTFLNHGSFGACPTAVLKWQTELRAQLEREPVQFLVRELPRQIDAAREAAAAFVGARPDNLGFVGNATAGVNAVLRSLRLGPGDEILVTDHGYNACTNVARYVADRNGARVVVAPVPFPIASADEVVASVLEHTTARTKVALLDHVTSPTGLVLPVERMVAALAERGVDTLVDGAHAPGMLALDLEAMGAAWYTGNFHKHPCAPKGAAILWVRPDKQADLHPAVISHGYNASGPRSRWLEEIDWQGTSDPTPWLCVPTAIDFVGGLVPGGWSEIRTRNRALALQARDLLCAALEMGKPAPDDMIGWLVALPLWDGDDRPPTTPLYADALQVALFDEARIEVPIPPWPAPPRRLVRVSAHLYNELPEYERLAAALVSRRP